MNKITLLVVRLTVLMISLLMVTGTVNAKDTFIVLDSKDMSGMLENIKYIESFEGKATHRFPFNVIIGDIPDNNIIKIKENPHVVKIYDKETGVIDVASLSGYGKTAEIAANVWNNNYAGFAVANGLGSVSNENMAILINDTLIPSNAISSSAGASAWSEPVMTYKAPYGAGFYDTSEYMIGNIAVGVILPESNGDTDKNLENWTTSDEYNAISYIQKGLDWWAKQDHRTKLTFTYDIHYKVPTGYEPIYRPFTDENLWTADTMNYLGFNKYYYIFDNIRDYDNAIRDKYKTDWAFTIFLIRWATGSLGIPDGGNFNHAYLGGPYETVIYDIKYGTQYTDRIVAHETGHVFYATDEYNRITPEYSGYLNANEIEGSKCVMGFENLSSLCVSLGTAGQLGWRDSNNNGVFDIVDFSPIIKLNKLSSLTNNNVLTYTGRATATDTYPNNNPIIYPIERRHNITINKIITVQYRIDNGSWMTAVATDSDGSFDSSIENFTFTTSQLPDGTHKIDARSLNTAGYWSYDSDTITVQTENKPKLNVSINIIAPKTIMSGQYLYIQTRVADGVTGKPVKGANVIINIDKDAIVCIPEEPCSDEPIQGLPKEIRGTTNGLGTFGYSYKTPIVTKNTYLRINVNATKDSKYGKNQKVITVYPKRRFV